MKKSFLKSGIEEMLIEDNWRLSRKFMHEIEEELDCKGKLPVNLLLASSNLRDKWIEYSEMN